MTWISVFLYHALAETLCDLRVAAEYMLIIDYCTKTWISMLYSCFISDKPSTDSPAMAHSAFREIVERAVEEARKLPGLSADAENPREGRAIADHSYEDLLATAILNKVLG